MSLQVISASCEPESGHVSGGYRVKLKGCSSLFTSNLGSDSVQRFTPHSLSSQECTDVADETREGECEGFLTCNACVDSDLKVFFGSVEAREIRCDNESGALICKVPSALKAGKIPVVIELLGETKGFSFFTYNEMSTLLIEGRPEPAEQKSLRYTRALHMKVLKMFRGEIEGELEETEQRKALSQFAAEAIGTYFIVVFGCGSVCSAVLTGSLQGLWQVAVVWGFGVSLAIYATGSISGAHLNPSVSFAFALLRPWDFSWSKMLLYWAAQIFGAVLGGATNYFIFKELILEFERVNGIERGSSSSVMSAMIFGEYYPNPGLQYSIQDGELEQGDLGWSYQAVSTASALGIEAWGTGILMFFILALTDPHNKTLVTKDFAPFFIGFTVAVLISIYAPLTQAGWNPARDLGPRIVAYFAGWGEVAIPGPRGGFWIYILGPLIGAPCGGALYDFIFAASVRAS